MLRFEMEAPIVMDTTEEIVKALRDIADGLESGDERGFVPGECQCMEWYLSDDVDEDFDDIENDEFSGDEYGCN